MLNQTSGYTLCMFVTVSVHLYTSFLNSGMCSMKSKVLYQEKAKMGVKEFVNLDLVFAFKKKKMKQIA